MEKTLAAEPPVADALRVPQQSALGEQNTESPPTDEPASPSLSVKEKSNDEPAEEEFISGFKLFAVLWAVTVTCFLMLLDTSIIGTAIPQITTEFHSLPDVGWYGASYLLANCALTPLTGKIYTYFKSKWTFMAFVGVFELGSLICGVAPSSNALIIGRAIAGLGTSGIMNGGITIMAHSVPLQKRPLYMGILMSFAQLGVLMGPLLGGVFTEHVSWRWCFYINLPIGGAVCILLIFISIPDKTVKDPNRVWNFKTMFELLDIVGFALFTPCAVMFLLALEWGGITYPWNSATVIGLFCGCAGMLVVFLYWEYRQGDRAMIPFSMVRQRVVWSSCVVLFFFMASMLIQSYYLPIYFQTIRDATPTLSGVYLLPSILSQIIFAVVSGVFVSRVGYVLPWSIACGVLTAVAAGLFGTFTPYTTIAAWIGFQILAGSGRGMGLQMPLVQIQNVLPPAQVSIGMSLAVFGQTFGGALFLSFAETVFTTSLKEAIPEFAPEVNVVSVIQAGASGVRNVVSEASLPGVLLAYNQAINHVFFLSAGAAAATFIFCWGMGWKSLKKKEPAPATEA